MSNIGTPDWQRGVVNAQKLLAVGSVGEQELEITLPANAKTLIIVAPIIGQSPGAKVTGMTTGAIYPVSTLLAGGAGDEWQFHYATISGALDAKVKARLSETPTAKWYIYTDTAQHVELNPVLEGVAGEAENPPPAKALLIAGKDPNYLWPLRVNAQGIPYAIPSAPNTASGDHPPNELQVKSGAKVASPTTILAAPGEGMRYRLFWVALSAELAADYAYMQDTVSKLEPVAAGPGAAGVPVMVDFKPSGWPMGDNGELRFYTEAGNATYSVVYTTETI